MEDNMADQNTERDPLEILAAEYMERLRQGESLSIEEFASQHPEFAADIRELFPAIAATERLKAQQARSSDGCATLGAVQLTRLGDFRIIREIGRGGMGVVFEAEQISLAKRVAIKVLPRQVLLDEKHLKRFQREARIAANLHHTNIVEVFGVGEQDGFHYYVMQYIEGVGLDGIVPELVKTILDPSEKETTNASNLVRHLLGQEGYASGSLGPAYWQAIARIGWQAADALSYAHSQGVLHRDIKPANLLLDQNGTLWLTDFGLAKAAQSDDVTLSKDVVGTLRYMPPEQFRGKTDHRSDIYSLGLTLYELLTLQPAYEDTNQSRLMQRIIEGPPLRPGAIEPGIPRDLETIIIKATSHDAGERYQSAADMADDLRCFMEDRPIRARRASPAERLGRWCRRNKALASMSGTILFLLLLVAVVASVGYLRTKSALHGEAIERAKAEANATLAIEALDHAFDRLYPIQSAVRPQPAVEGLIGENAEIPNTPILSRQTAALLEEMLPFYDRLAQQTGSREDLQLRTAEANRRVGAIRQRLGRNPEAVKAYERAIVLFGELNSPKREDLTLKIAQIHNDIGRLYTSQREAGPAQQSHQNALGLLQTDATRASVTPAMRFELARTYFFLGLPERPLPGTAPREGRGPQRTSNDQREYLVKAVTLLSSLAASTDVNPECQHLLALCYLEGAPGEGRERGGGDERAIRILEELVKRYPKVTDYAYDLSEAYVRLHIPDPPIPREVEDTIEERFQKASTLLEQLVAEHSDVPDFLAFQARVHHKLGSFYQQIDRWPDAERNFRKAITCQLRLLEQFPDAPYYTLWMATFRLALADALIRRDQPGEARSELESAISILSLQLKQRPDLNSFHEVLARAYSQLEKALRRIGEKEKADDAARKAEQERNSVSSMIRRPLL
jgi:eukaryotic-like serine/threonine-protein kinase